MYVCMYVRVCMYKKMGSSGLKVEDFDPQTKKKDLDERIQSERSVLLGFGVNVCNSVMERDHCFQ